jgi:hypothetical protein
VTDGGPATVAAGEEAARYLEAPAAAVAPTSPVGWCVPAWARAAEATRAYLAARRAWGDDHALTLDAARAMGAAYDTAEAAETFASAGASLR